jgi:hypothetical protein
MMLDTRVQRETTWTWQPGQSLRASEPTATISDGERVHRTLKRVAKARAVLDAQEATALREAQRIRLWERFGYTSLVDYMERELGYTARSAIDRLRVANAIEEVPELGSALEQGELSLCGARTLAPVLTPKTQEAWLARSKGKTVREIEELVAGHKPGDLPSDPADDALRLKALRFEVTPATAALVRHFQKLRARELGALIDDDLLIREVFQLALDELASRGTKAVAPETRRRYQIAVVICELCRRGSQNTAGTNVPMTTAEVARACCDADDIGRVDLPGIRRKRSTIPPALRRKVAARDGHRCRVPGCRSTNIDAHHIKHLANGGVHHELNLITLCEAHHLAIHNGTLLMTGELPNVEFTFAAKREAERDARATDTERALVQLGYKSREAAAAVATARTHVGDGDVSLETWLRVALSKCPRPVAHDE